ncbi:hypothetical protein AVEN_216486-1 [Araneus ventricosus]|uniref:Uncharacterized protein n=1 Tax=Araneus ventricosus TaxID=182803 RepID=A0A4Y2BN66_ARAVE|nr:hypothetical protein AVEN_216486-1 [Araneus ventricosus]
MSIFAGARKCDLKILAEELGETVNDNHKLKDLKKMILASKEYDEESAKEWLNTIINERKERAENKIRKEEIAEQKREEEMAERRRQDEIQIAEQKRQEAIELRKLEYEERKWKEEQEIELRKLEYEERKRKDEMEFELQKIRLGAEADIEVDNVKAENLSIYVVPDDAQSVDLIIGRTWLDLSHIAYTKIGERFHIGYREDELFRNFLIDEKVNPVCLKHLERAQSESESLQIKDSSQLNMMGNLANDLKMEKNKNVDNLKSNNDSLVKTNSYYDKNKSGKVLLRKGDIVAVRRKPNMTIESTKPQPRYRGPMVVTQVRPSDKYRISQLEPRNGRLYATIVHVSQLKAWRSRNEDDDDSSTNSHNEPEMQRSKRIVRKSLRYGDFMPDR